VCRWWSIPKRAILADYYASRGSELTEMRLRMARVPEGAGLIPNRYSGAPGIHWGNIYIMAGVPMITAGMLDALTGSLEGGLPVLAETVGCWVGERSGQTAGPDGKGP
jgi:molybdopterin-biosynthesis enzyme MoeA-like protein